MFDDLLIQPVISISLRLIRLLNSIPIVEGVAGDKYKMPFTECLFMNTQNLQRSLRRSLFKCYFTRASEGN